MNDRIEAMRILSAGNTIMILVLGAILGLQVSPADCSAWVLGWCDTIPLFHRRAGHVSSRRLVADAVSRTLGLPRLRLLDALFVLSTCYFILRSADV